MSWVTNPRELRKFGLVLGGALLGIGWLLRYKGHAWGVGPLAVGGGLVLLGVIFPGLLKPFHWLWMRFAFGLGWLNTRILLGLVFYLLFTPCGLLMRLVGRDPLARRWQSEAPSYWVDRKSETPDPKRMERLY